MMKNYQVGLVLLTFVIAISILNYSYEQALSEIVNTTCTHGLSCPMYATLKAQHAFSVILIIVLIAVSGYFISIDYLKKHLFYAKIKIAVSGEEKKIYELLKKGSISQNNLINETGITKVKMTRILNRLEKKDLIERKRSGTGNIVELKTGLK
ncbi:MAG TPA: MarR family transcriptional regulator [Candidatus Nanoarchaeia archaeon]|nr:MarR family transcriptional regulator [Candidatus Nanoarchaeia archaeon]